MLSTCQFKTKGNKVMKIELHLLFVRLWGVGGIWIVFLLFEAGAHFPGKPADSGCAPIIKNYGCYCPQSSGRRKIPRKCDTLFDEELTTSNKGFPAPVTLTYPNLSPHLKPIEMSAQTVCVMEKYCEIVVEPADNNWGIIDWCLTTTSSALYHLQLLGPPHSPVCCDKSKDQLYSMLCMRRDFNLQRFLEPTLLISVYIKLLPRAPVSFRLSLVLLNKLSSNSLVPAEFSNKTNFGGAQVKLLRVEGLVLDLSQVRKWEDL